MSRLALFDIEMILRANYFICKKIDNLSTSEFIKLANKNIDNIVHILYKDYQINDLLLVRDSKSFRYNILDTYKSGRHNDIVYNELASDFYASTSYDLCKKELMEADDILYILSSDQSIIVSNDHDLQQAKGSLFSPTRKTLIKKEPIDYLKLIVKGCSSDTIPALIKPFYPKSHYKIDLNLSNDDLAIQAANLLSIEPGKVLRNIELVLYREETYLKYIKDYKGCLQ